MNEQMVRELAYRKWELAGYPCGDGVNFWLEAEEELQKEYAPKRKPRATPTAAAAKVTPISRKK